MAKKPEYYRLDKLDQLENISYAILLGQRSNGKSYAVKERVLQNAWNKKEKFVIVRRFAKDIKETYIQSYFEDIPVEDITNGTYNMVVAFRGFLYWGRVGDDNKVEKAPDSIGRYCALNEDSRYKSQVFDGTTTIVYEEFIPIDNMYIENECSRVQHFASSVFRRRKGIVYLIGNTLSRVSPYAKEWNVDFTHMKPGDLEVYHHHVTDPETGEDTTINVAVEYCAVTKYKNTMFFGKSAKQILSGEWEVNDANKLPGKLEDYENVYKVLIEYQNFKFILNLLVSDNGDKIVYIYPSTTDYHGDRIITDRFSVDPFVSARLDTKKKAEKCIAECFRTNKVCYSDNLTGSDFNGVNEHFKLATIF